MSQEQLAFLMKDNVPNREAWQNAITKHGFEFELDSKLTPFEDSGFLPCQLQGRDAGFEIYYDDSTDILDTYAYLRQDRNSCIMFVWGGSMTECASVMIASYVLAKEFGAIVSYQGEDPYESMDDFYNETLGCIEDAKKEKR